MSDADERPSWAGQRAMAWVIDDAPVPIGLAWTLIVIARRCDDSGRGSYQSIATLAAKTGKSEKQARRDVSKLLDLGLIRLGDQTLPERNGVADGRRPTVYDVALDLSGLKPSRQSKNPTGLSKADSTPPMHATPPMQGTPPMDGYPTPPMHAPATPPMHGSQIKPLKNPLNNPPSPYPLEAVEVVDAEILEEGEDSTASLEHQIQELIDQVVALKPNWQTLRTDIAQQIRALLGSFGGNLDIVTGIALGTAGAPDSAKPSRMTASGNPFVVAASRDLLIAKADALGSGAPFTQPHPEAHPFEPDTGGIDCTRCKFPKTNGRHKVGNQGGGYVAQRGSAYDDWKPNSRHRPYRDPQDLSEYDKPFFP